MWNYRQRRVQNHPGIIATGRACANVEEAGAEITYAPVLFTAMPAHFCSSIKVAA